MPVKVFIPSNYDIMYSDQYTRDSAFVETIPGHLRINVSAARVSRENASEIETLLRALPGVSSASANFRTGNVLVSFDEEIHSHADLLALLVETGHLEPQTNPLPVVDLLRRQ